MQNRTTLTLAAWLIAQTGALPAADFIPEQPSVATMPPATATRLYISDVALSHIIDGRLFVVDGASFKYLGTIGTGFVGLATVAPEGKELYVATSYYSRLNRGTRTDVVDVYDAQTLKPKTEIAIPPKHAQALPYKGTITTTADGRFILVQNATPASSIAVVDRKAAKYVTEIPTPGCWSILPAHGANRFTTVCGDGTLLTITLDAAGQPTDQQRSERLFDPDQDPIYSQTENDGDNYWFLSFNARLYSANLGAAKASIGPSWSLVDDTDKQKNWRPGGYQPFAYHAATHHLYVAMHPDGKEGSHKDPAAEIWSFDVRAKQRIERVEGNHVIALALSHEASPKLFGIDPLSAGLVRYDTTPALKFGGRLNGFGEDPILIQMQP